ncbi:hypothetical protein [Nonomuraea rubra]|uniref:Putative dehydrogenase n=1 Tax=Nonomuraea rubra TaxID=46180 RepID=A0A7X0NX99_9ACTN|nr:hypothetical protein [Nonomuraea rubra]MBB6551333.1 putative dehydrogenase [Nonomuraea rubra]
MAAPEGQGRIRGSRPAAAPGGARSPWTTRPCSSALFIALFIGRLSGRLSGGGPASFEATRFASGGKNALRIEVNGALGSLAFDFEATNDLWFHDHTLDSTEHGIRRVRVTGPDHPYAGAWWPPGHGLGYEHAFVHGTKDFLEAIAAGTGPAPSFGDGLRVQRVLAAVEQSAAEGSRFTTVEDS